MIRLLTIAMLMILMTSASVLAGVNISEITVLTESEEIVTYAEGAEAEAEANIHSVMVQEGAQPGHITIEGELKDGSTLAVGSSARAVSNVGTVRIGY